MHIFYLLVQQHVRHIGMECKNTRYKSLLQLQENMYNILRCYELGGKEMSRGFLQGIFLHDGIFWRVYVIFTTRQPRTLL